jgi:hypothetical protein
MIAVLIKTVANAFDLQKLNPGHMPGFIQKIKDKYMERHVNYNSSLPW